MSGFVYAVEIAVLVAAVVYVARPRIRARRLGATLPIRHIFAWRIGGVPPDMIVDAYLAERAAGHELPWIAFQQTWLAHRDHISNAVELARFTRERARLSALTRART